jgi:hypothetical protein
MANQERKQSFYDRNEGHYEYRRDDTDQRDWSVNDDFRPAQTQSTSGESGGPRKGYGGEPPFQRPGKPPQRSTKGFKRSDERIREDVSERFAQQERLDPSEIEVSVANGEVTLSGTVDARHEKYWAEQLADETRGVNEVHNQLRIRRDRSDTMTAITNTTR